uniref:Polyadenylate-binding protein-interacting protein 2-like isoform X1 n=2 Tax=Crassostrea virginica TaxID=6565 RepID=A0A8B8AGA6_CRAVI|nr:polyadenylate-binding protein-interacting protein 2-like isoform X1 [Crassostrea virginica]
MFVNNIVYGYYLMGFSIRSKTIMNMKLPPYLQEEVENLAPFGNEDLDFSEFEWMADQELEEFDRQMEEEYWEGEFIEACFEEMLQEEEDREMIFFSNSCSELSFSTMDNSNKVFSSKLNPNAPEFIPTTHRKGKA